MMQIWCPSAHFKVVQRASFVRVIKKGRAMSCQHKIYINEAGDLDFITI